MGMYDTINGEQVKIFDVPIISLGDEIFGFLSFSGGSLCEFGIGDEVPYKTKWYNYTKNFNILDFFPEFYDETVIHIIRDGKNEGIIPLSSVIDEIFTCDCYDSRGRKMKISSKDDIEEYIKKVDALNEATRKKKNDAFRAWGKYTRENKSDPDYKEKYKELYYLQEVERKENEEFLRPFRDAIDNYFLPGNLEDKYVEFGGIMDSLTNPIYENALCPGTSFLISDERLIYIVGYNEMMKFVYNDSNFLKDYFTALNFTQKEIDEVMTTLNKLEENYKKFKELVITEEQLDRRYILSDIIDGRFKKFYKKYDVLPYEGFDYTLWDVCISDIKNNNYDDFNKELDAYVKNRMGEER